MEGEKQSLMTEATWPQGLIQSYGNQNNMALAEEWQTD